MKSTLIAVGSGILTFAVLWWGLTALLPSTLLVPSGALALVAALLVGNLVDNAQE